MSDAYIFDAVHTPRGRRGGSLAEVHPVDLFTVPLAEVRRTWEGVLPGLFG